MLELLQHHQEARCVCSTATGSRVYSLCPNSLFAIGGDLVFVTLSVSYWVNPNGERCCDKRENESFHDKHGKQSLVDDARAETDIEHDELDETGC
jgi:hypothetical protein